MKDSRSRLLAFIVTAAIVIAVVQVGLLRFAFHKLGLVPTSAASLAAMMLFGSFINVPLFSLRTAPVQPDEALRRTFRLPMAGRPLPLPMPGRTVIAVNVGGCLAPVGFSVYLLVHVPLAPGSVTLAVLLVSAVAYIASFPVPKVGIVMPIFLAPVAAAIAALAIDPEHAPSLAYVAGTLGVLIGADLLHIGQVRRLGGDMAAIGGAGTFDGIVVTGIVAVLLA